MSFSTRQIMNGSSENNENKMKRPTHNSIPEKQFRLRNSLLTDLCEKNPHVECIYNMFIAHLLYMGINEIVYLYFVNGEALSSYHLVYASFGKSYVTLASWIGFFLITCSVYLCFTLWAKIRTKFSSKSNILNLWDYTWLLLLVGYYITSFHLISFIVTTYQLPLASTEIIVMEKVNTVIKYLLGSIFALYVPLLQKKESILNNSKNLIRFLMKSHSFIRSNAPKVLRDKTHGHQKLNLQTSFQKFIYFLFAPTLIYRDEYPRTKKIRWNFILFRFLEIIASIFYSSFIINKYILPAFKDFGTKRYSWIQIITTTNSISIPSFLLFLMFFLFNLHSLQNLFAELFRFGDRLFYNDWWTCSNFPEYLRKWNIIVNDWLYTFVYRDMYEIVVPGNKKLAKITVFLLSAFVHEWMLYQCLGFFAPITFILFIFGGMFFTFLSFIKGKIFNIVIFWYGFTTGVGIIIGVFCMEYYGRINCPVENYSIKDYFFPMIFTNNDCY